MLKILIIRGSLIICAIVCGSIFFVSIALGGSDSAGGKVNTPPLIKIETPTGEVVSAPMITEIFVDETTAVNKPFIIGETFDDTSVVRIVIDNVLHDEALVKNGQFNYQSVWPLKQGEHFVYVTTVNIYGQESKASEVINFFITPEGVNLPNISATRIEGDNADATTTNEVSSPEEQATSSLPAKKRLINVTDWGSIIFFLMIIVVVIMIYFRTQDRPPTDDETPHQESLFKE